MEEILVIASSCDEDRPIERIDASRRTPYYYSHVGGENFRYLSGCFHVFHVVQISGVVAIE